MVDQFEIQIEIQPLLDVLHQNVTSSLENSDQIRYLKACITEAGLHDQWDKIQGQYVQYRMGRELLEDPVLMREYLLSKYPSLLFEPILQPMSENTSKAISDTLIKPIEKSYLPYYEQTIQATLKQIFQA